MSSSARTLCATCQCKTVEFVIAFSGPTSCRSADVCRYDEPGYPWKIYCDKYKTHAAPAHLTAVSSEQLVAQTGTDNTRGVHAN
jgi:hypothetical protein